MNTDIQKLIGETTVYDKKQLLEAKRPESWLKSVSAITLATNSVSPLYA